MYVAAKGGFNCNPHGDMDIGSFVLDALGQRWFYDFGSDSYQIEGYLHHPADENAGRWTSYRKRAEGHNTIVVNPGQNSDVLGVADMLVEGYGVIGSQHSSTPDEAWAYADLTAAHPDLESWRRGWRLFDGRTQVLVQDEISCNVPSEIWAFYLTLKRIQVAADGRSATLTADGAELAVRLIEPAGARLVQMDAEPLPTSPPPPDYANPNEGWRKLGIHLTDVGSTTIAVQFSPLHPGETPPPVTAIEPLGDW